MEQYIVICRADRVGRRKGPYVLATRQVFAAYDAAAAYARTVAAAREPIAVAGRFGELRLPVAAAPDAGPKLGA
jgi:hypothetical protein